MEQRIRRRCGAWSRPDRCPLRTPSSTRVARRATHPVSASSELRVSVVIRVKSACSDVNPRRFTRRSRRAGLAMSSTTRPGDARSSWIMRCSAYWIRHRRAARVHRSKHSTAPRAIRRRIGTAGFSGTTARVVMAFRRGRSRGTSTHRRSPSTARSATRRRPATS